MEPFYETEKSELSSIPNVTKLVEVKKSDTWGTWVGDNFSHFKEV